MGAKVESEDGPFSHDWNDGIAPVYFCGNCGLYRLYAAGHARPLYWKRGDRSARQRVEPECCPTWLL